MGYKTVALSSSDAKRDLAQSLGAHVYVDGSKEDQTSALQALGGANVVLTTIGDGKAIAALIKGLAEDGKLIILAGSDDLHIPVGMLSCCCWLLRPVC
jgi:D-arabinose 1-dehydrogenase-like Zn-dependent alcohol dehydrogenase